MTAETVKVYREGGAWMAKGKMYWPVLTTRKGKRESVEHVHMGYWTRPATEDEISTMGQQEARWA